MYYHSLVASSLLLACQQVVVLAALSVSDNTPFVQAMKGLERGHAAYCLPVAQL